MAKPQKWRMKSSDLPETVKASVRFFIEMEYPEKEGRAFIGILPEKDWTGVWIVPDHLIIINPSRHDLTIAFHMPTKSMRSEHHGYDRGPGRENWIAKLTDESGRPWIKKDRRTLRGYAIGPAVAFHTKELSA